ncbi:MAG TPA: zinc-dependent metalloprotease [Gemmatimonadales bacterium]|nr:zinc-dependent metalloprotease [Gemmatimonadales bacterium]
MPMLGRILVVLCLAIAPAAGQGQTRADVAGGHIRRDGFIPLVIDSARARLWLDLPSGGQQALLAVTLATGLGSNPIGLDRGADGPSYVVRFERSGSRVLVRFENSRYRTSGDGLHARTIEESFPGSTIAALPIVAEDSGRILVEATDLAYRDWNDVAATLQGSDQGTYSISRDRSRLHDRFTRAFPANSEIDVELTFATTGRPGRIVNAIVPNGQAFTLRQHLTLAALPDSTYRPRAWDPRTGYFGSSFKDYFQPLDGRLDQRVIARHRLQRVDPADPRSPIVRPIVYYIDPGIPEPVRTATYEGAKWWEEAFTRAGLAGGFRVEWLPADADPMDLRFNVVQWENRNERGWSIGGSLGDPRTGEILKGMARMDSHRARTDYNLYAALMGAAPSPADTAFILARVRQVTAHEIGHTLGLAHNYIASTYERGSVMDYPTPRVRVVDGEIDLRAAYASGPGDFDVWAIRWGYGIWPAEHEADSLRAIVADGLRRGYLYLSDSDARPDGAADPRTNLWDDSESASTFLQRQLAVREVGMARFGLGSLRPGEPLSLLEERFAPLYFWHRFAVTALAKTIGGATYHHAVVGDGQTAMRAIAPGTQRAALAQLLATLSPRVLAIPDTILALLAPGTSGAADPGERFRSRTAPVFDELGAARTLAQHVVNSILQRERAARLVAQAAHDREALTLGETIDALTDPIWTRPAGESRRDAALRRVVARAVVDRLLELGADRNASPEVRDLVNDRLHFVAERAEKTYLAPDDNTRALWRGMVRDIRAWLTAGEAPATSPALVAPPFDPFGDDGW